MITELMSLVKQIESFVKPRELNLRELDIEELRRLEESTVEKIRRVEINLTLFINTFYSLDEYWPSIISKEDSIILSRDEKCRLVKEQIVDCDPVLSIVHRKYVEASALLQMYQSRFDHETCFLRDAYRTINEANNLLDGLKIRKEGKTQISYEEVPCLMTP